MEQNTGNPRPPLTLRELKRGRYYTLSEACLHLVPPADRRSLNTWIEELGITVYKSPVRGHAFLISHKDLSTIATLVGRTVQDEGEGTARGRSLIADLEARHAREVASLREEIEALKLQHASEVAQLKAEYRRALNAVQRAVRPAEEPSAFPVGRAETPPGAVIEPYIPPDLVKPHTLPPDVPPGSTFLRWFAEQHGASREVMTAAAKRGDIRAIAKPYGKDGTQYLLDPQMQDDAAAWLRRRGYGHLCNQCPHTGKASPV